MTYQVGDKVDLRYLNPPQKTIEPRRASSHYAEYLAGTKVLFLTMKDMIVMDITEPPIALKVSIAL